MILKLKNKFKNKIDKIQLLSSFTIDSSFNTLKKKNSIDYILIEELKIEEGVTRIEREAFMDNVSVTNLFIPSTLSYIDDSFAASSISIGNVYYTSTLESFLNSQFAPILSNKVSSLYVKNGDTYAKVSEIPYDLIKNIDYTLRFIDTLVLPEGITEFDTSIVPVTSLRTLTLPNSIKKISLGNKLSIICYIEYNGTLDEFKKIKNHKSLLKKSRGITLLNQQGKATINEVTIDSNYLYKISNINDVNISQNVKIISNKAFASSYIKSIHIPNTVESIGSYIFSSSTITALSLDLGIKHIEEDAFNNSSITSLTLTTIPFTLPVGSVNHLSSDYQLINNMIENKISLTENLKNKSIRPYIDLHLSYLNIPSSFDYIKRNLAKIMDIILKYNAIPYLQAILKHKLITKNKALSYIDSIESLEVKSILMNYIINLS